jgi:CHAD domain-containing protein
VRGFARILGPVRDLDVLVCETLPQIATHYPDDAVRGQIEAFEPGRAEARAAMQRALAAARPGAWLLAMQRWLMQQGSRSGDAAQQAAPLAEWARGALARGHRRIERDARAFATLKPKARHALRIAIKRQRYAAEFFESLFPDDRRQAQYVAVLRDAQDALGRARDLAVARELLAVAPHEAAPLRDFALGWLAAKADNAADAHVMSDFLHADTHW